MELALSDFLNELGRDTVSRLDKEKKSREISRAQSKKEEQVVNIPQEKKSKPKIELMQESNNSEELNEEFIEQALDYANIIIKTVRQSFDSKLERRKVMESIRSAINLYLGESNNSYLQPSIKTNENTIPQKSQNYNSIKMNDLTGQQISFNAQESQPMMENKLGIGIKEGADGKKHADLSNLSQNDINSLRVLSGIDDPPQ